MADTGGGAAAAPLPQSVEEPLAAACQGRWSEIESFAVGRAGSSHRRIFKMHSDLVQIKSCPSSSLELLEKAEFAVAAKVTFVIRSLWPSVGGLCVRWTSRCPQSIPTIVLLPHIKRN